MISRRSLVLAVLVFLPVLLYGVLGGYALWQTHLLSRVWWLAPAFWVMALILAKVWPARHPLTVHHHPTAPPHWTARDRQAAQIVRQYQEKVEQHTPDQLADLQFYQSQGQELAAALARHYHPQAADPFSELTVPEVVAAVRLAVDDMEQWLLNSVPGSRLLTIRQWLMLQSAPKWIRRIQDATWAASILMNPMNIARYWSSKMTSDPVTAELQTELLAVVYLRFLRELGFYLIEMNSGRLRTGADAYRRAFPAIGVPSRAGRGIARRRKGPQPVTVSLVGQVSSGKSSLVNALTGVQQAAVDILPKTRDVCRYQVEVGKPPVCVTLLDTPGYGESGASKEQIEQIRAAIEQSHAVLVVMDAHSPARDADLRTLREIEQSYAARPQLNPPLLGVLTHIDLLSPALDWSPPYNWREPVTAKEHSIHDAVRYVGELFAGSLAGLVAVCADVARGRSSGVREELVPALTALLNQAQAGALLRAFEQELDRHQFRTLFRQVRRLGGDLLSAWIEERK